MRWIARLLGLLALAGAFAAAVLDGARWIGNGIFAPTTTSAALNWLAPQTFKAVERFVDLRFGAWIWDDVAARILIIPFSIMLIVIGAFLFLLSRAPPQLIGRSTRDR